MAADESECATLHVLTPTGEDIEVAFADVKTILDVKKRLQSLDKVPPRFLTAPTSALRLIFGTEVLNDDVVLAERGIQHGDQLSLILSSAPQGSYQFGGISADGPAGLNTSASITAEFSSDGECKVVMHEDEITSDDEDEFYDPFENGAEWSHCYQGAVHMDGAKFQMTIASLDRKGIFADKIEVSCGDKFEGEFTESDEVKLRLPFAAGSCNAGLGGFLWVTLKKSAEAGDKAAPDS